MTKRAKGGRAGKRPSPLTKLRRRVRELNADLAAAMSARVADRQRHEHLRRLTADVLGSARHVIVVELADLGEQIDHLQFSGAGPRRVLRRQMTMRRVVWDGESLRPDRNRDLHSRVDLDRYMQLAMEPEQFRDMQVRETERMGSALGRALARELMGLPTGLEHGEAL